MAAARQKEMKVSITELATTIRTRLEDPGGIGCEPADIRGVQASGGLRALACQMTSLRLPLGSVNGRHGIECLMKFRLILAAFLVLYPLSLSAQQWVLRFD